MDHHPCCRDLVSSDLHLFGSLAGKRYTADADVKQAVTPGYRHLIPVSSIPGYRFWRYGVTGIYMSIVTTWASQVRQLLPMCHVHVNVRISFSVLERLLPYFLRFFVCTACCNTAFSLRSVFVYPALRRYNISPKSITRMIR
jgi:hypothetical protein